MEQEIFQALRKAKLMDSDSDARATSTTATTSGGYSRSGRTDKGVSAVGQVIALPLKSAFHAQASWDEAGTKLVETKDLVHNAWDTRTVWAPVRWQQQRQQNEDASNTATGTTPIVRQQKELSEYPYDQILNSLLPDDIRVLGKSSLV